MKACICMYVAFSNLADGGWISGERGETGIDGFGASTPCLVAAVSEGVALHAFSCCLISTA